MLELLLGDFDQKRLWRESNETNSKAGQYKGKEPIIYSVCSPLSLVVHNKKAYFWIISALEASTLLKIFPYNTT